MYFTLFNNTFINILKALVAPKQKDNTETGSAVLGTEALEPTLWQPKPNAQKAIIYLFLFQLIALISVCVCVFSFELRATISEYIKRQNKPGNSVIEECY